MIAFLIASGVVFYITCTYIFRSYRDFGKISSRWYVPFPDMSFSVLEFYEYIERSLQKKGIFVDISRVTYKQRGVFSSRREYLRIERGEYIFLICAAPFGTDFFVSWWGGERIPFYKDLLPRIPGIGPILNWLITPKKTFYTLDTENMFEGTVRKCVQAAIDEITTNRGIRGLSDIERMPLRNTKWQ